jgi:putative ABC transport system ATP-binding protein
MPEHVLLESRQIGRRAAFGGAWLLRGVSLRIEAGQRIALAGLSGSGKTLLLRSLARLDPIEEGQIFWRGQPIRGGQVPEFRRRVIYLHQRATLVESRVEDDLRAAFDLKVNRDQQFCLSKILRWLQWLGRDPDLLQRRSGDLSGGEAQLVAIMRAVQLEPDMLLLDEPTAALDPQTAEAVERLVDIWHQQQPDDRALVWVTHNPEQSRRVARRQLTLQQGALIEADP